MNTKKEAAHTSGIVPIKLEVFAGTIVISAGNPHQTILCACEELEGRGGTHDSVRQSLKLMVEAYNSAPALLAERDALLAENAELRENLKKEKK